MSLTVNQTFKNYYTMRLGSLTTKHQIQSNHMLLYTNEVSDIAQRINLFEGQKVLAVPSIIADAQMIADADASNVGDYYTTADSNTQLAINGKYFDLPAGFNPSDTDTWGGVDKQLSINGSQIFIYKKANIAEYNATLSRDRLLDAAGTYYVKIPYVDSNNDGIYNNPNISNSRTLSSKLISGEFTFVTKDSEGNDMLTNYTNLACILQQQDTTAYQQQLQALESEQENINATQKRVQQEMNITETEITAIQTMMESTDKILQKNTETFKWGA